MIYVLIAGSVLCGWALLRNIGNERERRTRALEDRVLAEQAAAAAAAKQAEKPKPATGPLPHRKAA